MPAEKAEVGRILKTITVIGRNGKVLPEKVEIRNTLKDMRIMKDGNVCYQHCEKCRYGHWTGDHYACRYRYKKGPALW